MSLDTVRDAISRAKKNEIASCVLSRKRKLGELYAAATYIHAGAALQDAHFAASPAPSQLTFLDENDIEKGRYYRESTLPFPPTDAIDTIKPSKDDKQPTAVPPHISVAQDKTTSSTSLDDPDREVPSSPPLASSPIPDADGDMARRGQKVTRSSRQAKAQDTLEVVEQTTNGKARAKGPIDVEKPSHGSAGPPHTSTRSQLNTSRCRNAVKLEVARPAEDVPKVAEDVDADGAAQREPRDEENVSSVNGTHPGEAVSSPSSTVGPCSTNTPHPNHPSPDTSPDEESFPDGVPAGHKRAGLSPDRHPHTAPPSQKGPVAPNQNRSRSPVSHSTATPDAQLRFEEQQTAKLSRESSRPGVKYSTGQPPVSPLATPAADHVGSGDQEDGSAGGTDPDHMDLDRTQHSDADVSSHKPAESAQGPSQTAFNDRSDVPDENAGAGAGVAPPTSDGEDVQMGDIGPEPSTSTARMSAPNLATTSDGIEGPSDASSRPARPPPLEAGPLMNSPEPLTTGRSLESARTPTESARIGKHRRRRSQVVFPKQLGESRLDSMQRTCLDYAALKGASQDEKKDYLQALFEWQAYAQPGAPSLDHLIGSANKTLTTANHAANVLELHNTRILKRVYSLQNANRWSCRQMERSAEPPRPATIHDALLRHAKLMSTDFREERKWKVAAARNLADACAAWVAGSPDERRAMQVRAEKNERTGPYQTAGGDVNMVREDSGMHTPDRSQPTPDLIPSNGSESEQELLRDELTLTDLQRSTPPTALFSLGFDDVIFKMEHTRVAESLLRELPQYESKKAEASPDAQQSIVPVSKFINSKLASRHLGPPRKKKRYEYEEEEDLPSYPSKQHALDHSISLSPSRRSTSLDLPAEQTNVALFNPENKHLRERLHASHAFRPPTEFQMPPTSFFESRASSQWQWDEDQRLRVLVKEYSFNWSLISSCLKVPSLFNSGAERRTPWECFERWVQLEGLPAEMSKTQYFRTYQARLEAAQRTLAAQQQLQQQVQTPAQALATPRRRTMQPMRVERRRNNRYLALVDAMRKLARKKEQLAHKKQEAAKAADLRKAHEAAQPKTNVHTPAEFSRLRHDRDVKQQEKNELMRQQLNAQNRNHAMQRSGQMLGPNSAAAAAQQQRNGTPKNLNGNSAGPNTPATHPQASMGLQGRAHPSQAAMQNNFPNGLTPGLPIGVHNMGQQVNMQPRLQSHQADNLRIAMQQRGYAGSGQAQGQFQGQQHLNPGGNAAHMAVSGGAPTQAMLAALAGTKVNGSLSPSANGLNGTSQSSTSPRMGQHQPQHLSSGHIPAVTQISHQIHQQNPSLSAERVRHMASERLKDQIYQQQRQVALNAAAGTSAIHAAGHLNQAGYQQNGSLPSAGAGGTASPTLNYTPQMRQQLMQQQQAQQQAGTSGLNGGSSRSATPQGPPPHQARHQRTGSGTMGTPDGNSPAMQQSQLARSS